MTMVTVTLGMTAMDVANRAQLEVHDTAGDVEAGLALQAEGLQREGVGRTANQEVAAAADADRGIAANAAVAAGQVTRTDLGGRGMHAPAEIGLAGRTEFDAEAADGGNITFGTTAAALEHAIEVGRGRQDLADIRTAVAAKNANLDALLRVRRRERRNEKGRCCADKVRKSHGKVSGYTYRYRCGGIGMDGRKEEEREGSAITRCPPAASHNAENSSNYLPQIGAEPLNAIACFFKITVFGGVGFL